MFGSGVLDTIIGTCFVFLLISALVTIANELIAAALMSRAKWLRAGLVAMLDADWTDRLYAHPLIEGTAAGGRGGRGPSYVPSRAFANVLLDLVRSHGGALQQAKAALQAVLDAVPKTSAEELTAAILASTAATQGSAANGLAIHADLRRVLEASPSRSAGEAVAQVQRFIDAMPARYFRQSLEQLPNRKVGRTLLVLLDDAEGDFDKFKANIEIWFNNAMDRVGGWYKRKSQWIIAALSVGAAVFVNVDAILIVKYLGNNVGVRNALVSEATAYAQKVPVDASAPGASAVPSLREIQDELKHLDLPIGWSFAASPAAAEYFQVIPVGTNSALLVDTAGFHLLGWLLTALAATLGAPFWFDTLNRFISIRSAGKAPEDRPKPPRDVPLPLEPGQTPREADMAQAKEAPRS